MIVKTRKFAALFLFLVVMSSACFVCYAGERHDVRKIRDELARAERVLGLQMELPLAAPGEAPDMPWRLPGISADAAAVILYGTLLAFAVIMLLLAPANLWSFNRARKIHAARIDGEAERGGRAVRMEHFKREADELARMGDYVEAMHVLLLESVSELSLRANMAISESLTSREIFRLAVLPSEGTAAFADIISHVEISYYGLYRPGPDDYAACRNSFETLRAVLAGGRQ